MTINRLSRATELLGGSGWENLYAENQLLFSALQVASSRIGATPSHELWNSLLNCLRADERFSAEERAAFGDFELAMKGRRAIELNVGFCKSRVLAQRALKAPPINEPQEGRTAAPERPQSP